jgi:hypothetical protein
MRKALLVLAWLIPTVLWLLAITRWRRGIIERQPPGSPVWFWLRAFRIPETERNRARLLVGASAAGITMVTVGIGLVLLLGLE